jgi:beta-galactosidase
MGIRYGGDYNPEQWPEEVWADDVRLMREAQVNFVTVGVFSWALLEPTDGVFDFAWLDRVLDLLHAAGIAVDLATATASPPPWLVQQHPDILPEDADGVRRWPGSRQHYSPTSPAYRHYAARLTRKLAERYGNHPALVMWHINNEYGCHTNLDYSDAAGAAFRGWLGARYGSIDALNEAWGTAFWSQRYTSFGQILPPRRAPNFRNPTQMLDFQRFSSDALLECFLMEKAILNEVSPRIPVTTNFIGAFKPLDYWTWAPHLDVISDDSYPDPTDPAAAMKTAFARDLMRSLGGGRPWLLMEQATGHVQWRSTNTRKATGQMHALSMQAVARGADGINFFQWRQSRSGAEKFHTAMLPHTGTDTRIWRSVVGLGADLAALAPVEATRSQASVAVLLDWDSWWAIENAAHPQTLDYLAGLESWYGALYAANIAVDFARPDADLSGYTVVIAPQLYLLSPDAATSLATYVADGGTLLLTYYSGIVDGDDRAYLDGYLGALQPTLGIRIEEFAPLHPGLNGSPGSTVTVAGTGFDAFRGSLWSEFVQLHGAEPLAVFVGGDLDGCPAITRNASGRGSAWYVATQPEPAAIEAILAAVFDGRVDPVVAGLPRGVEAARRGDFLFLTNMGTESVVTTVAGRDLLTGTYSDGHHMAPFATVVIPAGAAVG